MGKLTLRQISFSILLPAILISARGRADEKSAAKKTPVNFGGASGNVAPVQRDERGIRPGTMARPVAIPAAKPNRAPPPPHAPVLKPNPPPVQDLRGVPFDSEAAKKSASEFPCSKEAPRSCIEGGLRL